MRSAARAFLFVLFACTGIAPGGCASVPNLGPALLAGGADVLTCAPEDYAAFKDATQVGGMSWLAAALAAIQCAGKVAVDVDAELRGGSVKLTALDSARDLEARANAGRLVADATGWNWETVFTGATPRGWTRDGIKRLARCVRLAKAMGVLK